MTKAKPVVPGEQAMRDVDEAVANNLGVADEAVAIGFIDVWHVLHGTAPQAFNSGNSQAVRIPAEFRLDTDRVRISRNEWGDVVIQPLRADRGAALLDALRAVGELDASFIAALEAEQASPQPLQERDPQHPRVPARAGLEPGGLACSGLIAEAR